MGREKKVSYIFIECCRAACGFNSVKDCSHVPDGA